ncbi:hypothetical protein Mycch_5363 (plasmid) [Mycolicibacterium chubuense NBB4]|uniref:Antitoxin Xre/MbcA/ParS-like toxin-binding domain-containing protein n=1 Tax=Mycolicibacterium chubuense (strain NBB4) TaxID=710421 RepID=I4BRY3_MYCCN|nr:hypothetical protein [Mycolicibacterium chubuense]AFM20040.1 hypothetical protein Mycch_5363 [Mycolicibacterium chubuense NBB4]
MPRIGKAGSAGKGSEQHVVVGYGSTGAIRIRRDAAKIIITDLAADSWSAGSLKKRLGASARNAPRKLGRGQQLVTFRERTLKEIKSQDGGASRDEKARNAEPYADSVLTALSTILYTKLGTLAAADIDVRSLGSPADVAEWLASALPSSHPFDEATGPFYDADGVARRLRTTSADVLRRAESNTLLACPTAEGTPVFPVYQFNADGSTVAGLSDVLAAMEGGTADRWQVALWMNTPVDTLNDQTPAQALRAGDAKAVRKLAEHTAARWRR